MTNALDALASALSSAGLVVRRDYPIGPLTTYRVGGSAAAVVEVADAGQAAALASITASAADVELLVVGNGSNLLVADAGFDGLAVRLIGPDAVDVDVANATATAGAAALLPVVARRTVAAGLGGFEWAVGVPGSIGGAVRMNAGGHGSDMAACLAWVHLCDLRSGETREVPVGSLDLGYRTSSIAACQLVIDASLSLRPSTVDRGEEILSEVVRWRREHQPGGQNAGSVFRNPDGDSAGRLIESSGCKGLRIGTAEVSTKHANFIQVDPGGSADDVRRVIDSVLEAVRSTWGVELHVENQLVGFADPLHDNFDNTDNTDNAR